MEEPSQFNLEEKLLDDFRIALSDTTGVEIPRLRMDTSLVHELHVNSLSYLEALQIVSDKYSVHVSTEELQGTIFAGRSIVILREKILAKFNNDLQQIEKIANENELNLAKDTRRAPAILSSFVVNTQGSKKRI